VLPSLYRARAQGTPCELLAIAAAGWLRYLRGIDEAGRRFPVEEPAKELRRTLSEDRQVRRALDSLERHGVRATMAAALDTEGTLAA
jgi:mannitol-1-phosphate/altronate dehydrogenase